MCLADPDVVITLFFEVPSLVIGRSSWVSTIPSRIPTRLHRGTCTLGYMSLVWIGSSYPLEVINGAPLPVGHLFPGRCPKLGKLLISSSHQSARSKHNLISSQFSKAFRNIFIFCSLLFENDTYHKTELVVEHRVQVVFYHLDRNCRLEIFPSSFGKEIVWRMNVMGKVIFNDNDNVLIMIIFKTKTMIIIIIAILP